MKVLVIEDEEKILKFLEHVLTHEGYSITLCESADSALENNYVATHDLVILDLMLEGIQGAEFVQTIRKQKSNIPILVLSALGQIGTKIDLLNLGVDDYMTKPFDAGELIARVEALYRRYLEIDVKDEEDYGEIKFFRKQNKVVRHGKEILLTNREGDLLSHLLKNEGKTVRT
ncbi:response regulator transcription factor [Pseudomonadota bacterium]